MVNLFFLPTVFELDTISIDGKINAIQIGSSIHYNKYACAPAYNTKQEHYDKLALLVFLW